MSTSQQEYDLMKELYHSFFLQLDCNDRKQFYFYRDNSNNRLT